ncbi:YlqD family protein [Neobacillus dielmonensis]|uniref:YlqD family protein n=1 Tax=Neobacillus dielmonensis TaxID=1347369 RepID=UPI0005A6A7A1|nr:YlqD family protein [Neobacillus dielmonensis]
MQIIQTVVVKQILTEKSKQGLLAKYQTQRLQLQKECDQLLFEFKRMEKTKTYSVDTLKKHFDKEIQVRKEKVKLLEFQMEQLHILPIGSELAEKEVQALIEVKAGDVWEAVSKEHAIIIKDGIVEEIR